MRQKDYNLRVFNQLPDCVRPGTKCTYAEGPTKGCQIIYDEGWLECTAEAQEPGDLWKLWESNALNDLM